MRVVIVGGHGKIALLLGEILTRRGDEVDSLIGEMERALDLGVCRQIIRNDGSDLVASIEDGRGKFESPGGFALRVRDFRPRGCQLINDPSAMFQIAMAHIREAQASRGAVKEPQADLRFQFSHPPRSSPARQPS